MVEPTEAKEFGYPVEETFLELTCGCIGRVTCCRQHWNHSTIADCLDQPHRYLRMYAGSGSGGRVCGKHRDPSRPTTRGFVVYRRYRSDGGLALEEYVIGVTKRNLPGYRELVDAVRGGADGLEDRSA